MDDLMGVNSSSTWDVPRFIPLDVCAASSINKAAIKSKTAKDIFFTVKQSELYDKWLYKNMQTYMGQQKPFQWQTMIHKIVLGWHQHQ